MGFPPPPDAPTPEQQDATTAEAGFEPSPSGAELCGFSFPLFSFNLNFKLPAIPIGLPPLPKFDFFVALNCDLSKPIGDDFPFGGGRVGRTDPDADETNKRT